MAEYLAPGVYIEETSFRSRSIEGVATSTTGFAGVTRYGPVQYQGGPNSTAPRLITSFTEFERVYGGLQQLTVGGSVRESYLAHAARAFFLNGGQRLYISRVFVPDPALQGQPNAAGVAMQANPPTYQSDGSAISWQARWPGAFGNALVTVQPVRRGNVAYEVAPNSGVFGARGVSDGAVVEIVDSPPNTPQRPNNAPLVAPELAVVGTGVDANGQPVQTFTGGQGNAVTPTATSSIREVVLTVQVEPANAGRADVYNDLATDPEQRRWIGKIMQGQDPEDEDAAVWLNARAPVSPAESIELMVALAVGPVRLAAGNDGGLPNASDLLGQAGNPDNVAIKSTGLEALGEVEDIAIVALPDGGTLGDADRCAAAAEALIGHAVRSQYRIAVVDAPQNSSLNEVRAFRGRFDTSYAAIYHPWIEIFDPTERPAQGAPPRRLVLPPSGFVTGIYARNDVTRGVYKAPANEIVRGLTKFEMNINKGRNDVLNPEGINALRFFEGRGNRVWGARTMSSDPEWKYVNVRRFFIYLENSIDRAMQWAVFEPNNERLWANIRQTVESFLYTQWLSGALLGGTPEEAYFVRCDRTTMTQNDLDNGRLICLIGVAPTKPAEFVIFRIGQWTADAQI